MSLLLNMCCFIIIVIEMTTISGTDLQTMIDEGGVTTYVCVIECRKVVALPLGTMDEKASERHVYGCATSSC